MVKATLDKTSTVVFGLGSNSTHQQPVSQLNTSTTSNTEDVDGAMITPEPLPQLKSSPLEQFNSAFATKAGMHLDEPWRDTDKYAEFKGHGLTPKKSGRLLHGEVVTTYENAGRHPVLDAFLKCVALGMGARFTSWNGCIEITVRDTPRLFRAITYSCSKATPTSEDSSRLKTLRRWFSGFPHSCIVDRDEDFIATKESQRSGYVLTVNQSDNRGKLREKIIRDSVAELKLVFSV
jgi:hypothetical protein